MTNPWPVKPVNPWPAQPQPQGTPWPQVAQQAQHNPFANLGPPQSLVDAAAAQKKLLNDILLQWDAAKKALAAAKDAEMALRKRAVELGFGSEDVKEGINTLPLENGYELKATRKLNYTLTKPANYTGETIDAVEECMENFAGLSNEGSFIADRLFKWSVDISVSEYKQLKDEATYSPLKKKLLDEVNKVLVITEAAPTLDIKENKRKKT